MLLWLPVMAFAFDGGFEYGRSIISICASGAVFDELSLQQTISTNRAVVASAALEFGNEKRRDVWGIHVHTRAFVERLFVRNL